MDKAWVNLPRPMPAYSVGVRNFVTRAMEKLGNPPKIQCPCTRCRNIIHQTSDDVVSHLVLFGMDKTYKNWIFHGEERSSTSSKMTCDRNEVLDTYIAQKLSNEFEVKSKKFKDIRAKNQTPHTMSRKGEKSLNTTIRREDVWCRAQIKKNGEVPTACITDCVSKIQAVNSSQTSHSTSLPINEDALSHTLGPERNRRVRGMGFGITPYQVGVHMNGSKKVEALLNQVSELRNQVELLKNLVMESMTSKGNENANTPSRRSQSIESRGSVNGKTPSPSSQNVSSNIRGSTNINARDIPMNDNVGSKCKLLNWQKTVVAEAKVASTDPNALAHHVPLGKDVWKVWVVVPLDPKSPLWRPNSDMSLIEDAIGSTVAWHKDFITFD